MATRGKKKARKTSTKAKAVKRPKTRRGSKTSAKAAGSGRKGAAIRPVAKKQKRRPAARKKTSAAASPMVRVKRVAEEIAHQATDAVSGGVDALRELGGSIVDRVTG